MFSLLRGFLLTSSPSLFTLNVKSAFSLQRGFGDIFPGEELEPLVVLPFLCHLHSNEIARDSPNAHKLFHRR